MAAFTVVMAPLAMMGLGIHDGVLTSLSGMLGIAGLWLVTAPRVEPLRRIWKLRVAGTFLTIPGFIIVAKFLSFEIRTGRDSSDVVFALFVCVLPTVAALHRLWLAWRLESCTRGRQ